MKAVKVKVMKVTGCLVNMFDRSIKYIVDGSDLGAGGDDDESKDDDDEDEGDDESRE